MQFEYLLLEIGQAEILTKAMLDEHGANGFELRGTRSGYNPLTGVHYTQLIFIKTVIP